MFHSNKMDERLLFSLDYKSNAKVARLEFVASKFPELHHPAKELILAEIKQSFNTDQYNRLFNGIESYDDKYVENADSTFEMLKKTVESDIRNAKSAVNEMEVGTCLLNLAELLCQRGNVLEARKFYSDGLAICQSKNSHLSLNIAAKLAATLVYSKMFLEANQVCLSTLSKFPVGSTIPGASCLYILQGLLLFRDGSFKNAALNNFMKVKLNECEVPSSTISVSDIGLYCLLCSFASFDRSEIKKHFISTKTFTNEFLMDNSLLKELLFDFYELRYGRFWNTMNTVVLNRIRLDAVIHEQADRLMKSILDQLLIQYCVPYYEVDLMRLSVLLNLPPQQLDKALLRLIIEGKIPGKIDAISRVMTKTSSDTRKDLINNLQQLADQHLRDAKRSLLRLSVLNKDMHIPVQDDQYLSISAAEKISFSIDPWRSDLSLQTAVIEDAGSIGDASEGAMEIVN